ncbi:hypothetical protein CHUAL_002383 [Chamberlinius hualienensis]
MSYEDPQGFYIPSTPPPPLPPAGFRKMTGGGGGGPNNIKLNSTPMINTKGIDNRPNKSKAGSVNKQQSVYTIPGYVPYAMNHIHNHSHQQQCQHDGRCSPQEVGLNFKGVDNPAFHHQEVNNKVPPPPLPPLRETTLSKNVNCTHNMMGTYSAPSSTDASLEKSSCCKKWTLHLLPSAKNRKCAVLSVLILAIILLVAALVVILFLTVGGGMDLVNSNKPEGRHKGNFVIDGTFRIVSVAFDADLNDPNTKLYEILRLEVSQALFLLFNKSTISTYYNRSDVLGFRNGSVIVDMRVFLSNPVEDAASKVTSAFVKGLVNMHGTVLLDKFVVDVRSIYFKVDLTLEEALLNSMLPSNHNSLTSEISSNSSTKILTPTSVSTSSSGVNLSGKVNSSVLSTPSSSAAEVRNNDKNVSGSRNYTASDQQSPFVSTTLTTLFRFNNSKLPLPNRSSSSPSVNETEGSSVLFATSAAPALLPVTLVPPPLPPVPFRPRGSSNSTYIPQRPVHPFIRPPALGRLPTSSHQSRPGLPPHLQIDFADSPGWSSWSPWSPCGNGICPPNKNSTQMRTRDCRTLNGSGDVLTDNRECLKKGGNRYEIRRCSCDEKHIALSSRFTLPDVVITTEKTNNTGRPCYECLASEICLAKHTEKEPSCRAPLDSKDQTGCGGWCNAQHEYCQHMANGAKRCIDDRVVCLPNEWQCGDGLCIPSDKRCDGHFNCYDTSDELNCKCEENYIRCGKNTSCLPPEKRCNRIIDCWDGSDEENCTKRT